MDVDLVRFGQWHVCASMCNGYILNSQPRCIETLNTSITLMVNFYISDDHVGEIFNIYSGLVVRKDTDILNYLTIRSDDNWRYIR